ncbi:actin [Aureococcus anophagefferens]|nr:actin [Aureococcus anophagefferens]
MERLAHCYGDEGLGVASDAHPCSSRRRLNAARHRERAAELLFESFNVPAAPRAAGDPEPLRRADDGLVLDVGDGVAHAVPVYEGFAVAHGVARSDVAGATPRTDSSSCSGAAALTTTAELDVVREVKERRCYVALDPAGDERAFGAASAGAPLGAAGDAANAPATR